jgi:exosome complex component RRP43
MSLTLSAEAFRQIYPEEFYRRFFSEGIRPDGRALLSNRKISSSSNVLSNTYGSSLVRIGNTSVLCGVTALLSAPSFITPDQGYLTLNLSVSPIAAPNITFGKPADDQVYIADSVRKLLLESGALRLDSLCVDKGSVVWSVFIDAVCISLDGNLTDAVFLAASNALSTTLLPKVLLPEKGKSDLCVVLAERVPLIVSTGLRSCTFALVCGSVVLDATAEEEELSTASLTIVMDEKADVKAILQAGGAALPSEPSLRELVQVAQQQQHV